MGRIGRGGRRSRRGERRFRLKYRQEGRKGVLVVVGVKLEEGGKPSRGGGMMDFIMGDIRIPLREIPVAFWMTTKKDTKLILLKVLKK